MALENKLEFVVMQMIESAQRSWKALPINLGGLSGVGGGIGTPPGGFVGQLIQTRVAYDDDELATSFTPLSGMSLLDNLNHIRYRLVNLESGSGVLTVEDYDGNPSVDLVEKIIFSGFVVTDLGNGEVLVQDIPGSGGGTSLTVMDADGTPTVENVDTIIFSGVLVEDLGSGDVRVTFSGGASEFGSNEFHIDQSGGTSDTYGVLSGSINGSNTIFVVSAGSYISSSLVVYLNGQLQTQGTAEDWVETDTTNGEFTFNTAPITGDLITVVYQVASVATGNADTVDGFHANAFAASVHTHDVISSPPGGRLTLTTGVPVTTSDVTGATTIYYTPVVHNAIELWDGSKWKPITFSETSLALGTMTNAIGYDVFAYLNSGVLALEKLAWSSATARATDVTLQDGRRCKSGDKTRFYLGSFYTTSTTTTEDSVTKRFLFNMYNRRRRTGRVVNNSSHDYNTATIRAFNNDQANSDVEHFVGLVEDAIDISVFGQIFRSSLDGSLRIRFGINSTTTEYSGLGLAITELTGRITSAATTPYMPSLGYSFYCVTEHSTAGTAPGGTFEGCELNLAVWA